MEQSTPPDVTDRARAVALGGRRKIAAAAIVLLGLVLRLHRLGYQELWLDESSSFHIATTSEWLQQLVANNTPPLYYVTLRLWALVAGTSQTALRLPSALLGTAFVLAVLWVGSAVFGKRVGLWSGFWAAISPLHIYYSQEARAYALVVLALLLTHGALWRALERNGGREWGLVCLCAALVFYSHYLGVFGLLPSVLMPLLWWDATRWRRYLISLAAALALFSPWVVYSFVLTRHSMAGSEWIPGMWRSIPPLWAIPISFEAFTLGGLKGVTPILLKQAVQGFPSPLRFAGLASAFAALLYLVVPYGDQRLGIERPAARKLIWIALIAVPLVSLWLVSWYKPLYVPGRYDLVGYAAYPVLLGLAFAKVASRDRWGLRLGSVLFLLLALPTAAKLVLYYRLPASLYGYKATAQSLHERVGNGEVVVFTNLRGLPVLYQLSRLGYRWEGGHCQNDDEGRRFACRIFPLETEQAPAVYDPDRVREFPSAVAVDARQFVSRLRDSRGSVYVVLGKYAVSEKKVAATRVDALLIGELRNLGFRPVSSAPASGMIQFRRVR